MCRPRQDPSACAGWLASRAPGRQRDRGRRRGRPSPRACARRGPAPPVTQIDVFDGDPALQAYLAPDDDQDGANTYTVKGIYAAHRSVTVRCQYGDEQVDVKLAKPVKACHILDKPEPQLSCK